jgi:hypothetical protein
VRLSLQDRTNSHRSSVSARSVPGGKIVNGESQSTISDVVWCARRHPCCHLPRYPRLHSYSSIAQRSRRLADRHLCRPWISHVAAVTHCSLLSRMMTLTRKKPHDCRMPDECTLVIHSYTLEHRTIFYTGGPTLPLAIRGKGRGSREEARRDQSDHDLKDLGSRTR